MRHGAIPTRFHLAFFHSTASVAAALGLAVVGCGPGAPAAVTVTDSAGVTVVSSTVPRWRDDTSWRLSEQPQVEIGGEDVAEEYQLYGIAGVLELEDRRIVVGNRGTHEIRYYNAQGRFLGSVGREGAGPGEFAELSSIERFGPDSLLIWDPSNYRYAVLDVEGNFGRHFRFQSDTAGIVFRPGDDQIVFADRTFLARQVIDWGSLPAGVVRPTAHYYRFDPSGQLLSHVIAVPFQPMKRQQTETGSYTMQEVLFSQSTRMAAGDTVFWVGTADDYVLREYRYDGRLLREIRIAGFEPTPLTDEMFQAVLQRRLDRIDAMSGLRPSALQAIRRNLRTMPVVEVLPPYRSVLLDAEGNLWVEHYPPPGEEHAKWDVFDGEGAWLGILTLPPRFEVREVGADYVLGVWIDDLDVEFVRQYGLIKGN